MAKVLAIREEVKLLSPHSLALFSGEDLSLGQVAQDAFAVNLEP